LIEVFITLQRIVCSDNPEVLADPVGHDNRVIEGIADDGQHSRQHSQVKIQSKQREDPKDNQHIMN